jgi:hypothetical protein
LEIARLTMRGLTRRRRAGRAGCPVRAADGPGQVDDVLGHDSGGLDDLIAGGVEGDGEAAAVEVHAAGGFDRGGDGDTQDLVGGQQGVDLLADAGGGAGA